MYVSLRETENDGPYRASLIKYPFNWISYGSGVGNKLKGGEGARLTRNLDKQIKKKGFGYGCV